MNLAMPLNVIPFLLWLGQSTGHGLMLDVFVGGGKFAHLPFLLKDRQVEEGCVSGGSPYVMH